MCTIGGCDRRAVARGMCGAHYQRWRKHGDPAIGGQKIWDRLASPEERFWGFVDKGDDCWMWTGSRLDSGYGRFRAGRLMLAHVFAFEAAFGPVPAGMELDHLCHTEDLSCPGGFGCEHRACVNPAHLEPVLHRENTLRGRTIPAMHAEKTHCPAGHTYDSINTYIRTRGGSKSRNCRACKRERQRSAA